MPLNIRQAFPEDLEAIQRLLLKTWHATYDATLGRDKLAEDPAEPKRRRTLGVDLPWLAVASHKPTGSPGAFSPHGEGALSLPPTPDLDDPWGPPPS
jgi:hypothetical protein